MDRYEWLECHSWLLPCSAAAVDWCFEGFASFYTSAQQPVEENEALSQSAAHLFFSVQASSLDPAQFAFKLGMAHAGAPTSCSDLVLSFDNGNYHYLDFKQVLAVTKWTQEQGCKICKETNYVPVGARREDACACQRLPLYVAVKLKHVSMIVYSRNQSSEGSSPEILGAFDVLCKAFEEKNIPKCHDTIQRGKRQIGSALCDSEYTTNLSEAHSASKQIMQQVLTKLDCMSECALAATNGCNADMPWIIRLLHLMMRHVVAHKEIAIRAKSLQCQLQYCLFSLEDEEERYISSIWAMNNGEKQEAREGAVLGLQRTLEKRKQVEEAIVWLELLET